MATWLRIGILNKAEIQFVANGISGASCDVSALLPIGTTTPWRALERDNPYLTPVIPWQTSNATGNPSQFYGKLTGPSASGLELNRARLGLSFLMPDLTNLIGAYLTIEMTNWGDTLEAFTPIAYMSNTDDSAGTGSWYDNLDNVAGDGVYGFVGAQTISLSVSALKTRSLAVASFVLGQPQEMANSGSGHDGIAGSHSSFSLSRTPIDPYISLAFS